MKHALPLLLATALLALPLAAATPAAAHDARAQVRIGYLDEVGASLAREGWPFAQRASDACRELAAQPDAASERSPALRAAYPYTVRVEPRACAEQEWSLEP